MYYYYVKNDYNNNRNNNINNTIRDYNEINKKFTCFQFNFFYKIIINVVGGFGEYFSEYCIIKVYTTFITVMIFGGAHLHTRRFLLFVF